MKGEALNVESVKRGGIWQLAHPTSLRMKMAWPRATDAASSRNGLGLGASVVQYTARASRSAERCAFDAVQGGLGTALTIRPVPPWRWRIVNSKSWNWHRSALQCKGMVVDAPRIVGVFRRPLPANSQVRPSFSPSN